MSDWGRDWLIASHGIWRSADGVDWERTGAFGYPVKAVLRQPHRLVVGAMWGLFEVLTGSARFTQLHDETLTEILALAPTSGDPGVVAASPYGIAWGQRGDLGATRWTSRSDSLSINERFSNAILADPTSPGRWLVGTEAGVLAYGEDGNGWERTSLTGTPCRALLRANDRFWAATDDRGVWHSADGLSWSRAGSGLDDGAVFALAPAGPDRLLAGTLEGVCVGDGRSTWRRLGPRILVSVLASHPRQHDLWLAGACPGGLWRSEDAGDSWRQRGNFDSVMAILPPEGSTP